MGVPCDCLPRGHVDSGAGRRRDPTHCFSGFSGRACVNSCKMLMPSVGPIPVAKQGPPSANGLEPGEIRRPTTRVSGAHLYALLHEQAVFHIVESKSRTPPTQESSLDARALRTRN